MIELYRHYFDEMPCYISVQDRDFRVIDSNKQFREDFGDRIGDFCYAAYKGRDCKCDFCPVEKTFRDGRRYGSEELVRTRNGRDVNVIVYTTPILNEKNEITAVMEMSTDVTQMKILEEKLRQSEERHRLLFDEVPCYISIQDRDFNLTEVNRRFREDFGDPSGGHCYEVYKHRDTPCQICLVADTFKDEQPHTSEEIVTSSSGEAINVLCHSAPLRDRNGKITSVMEMSANISQIRALQSQLTSIGLLISSISHGLKGLLNGLDGGVYLVNTGFEKKDDKRMLKGWEMVQRNVDRVRSMVMDILYYSKDREPNFEPLPAVDFTEEVLGLMEKRARDLCVTLVRSLDPSAGTFEGDRNALRSMLSDIIENSLESCRTDCKENHTVTVGVSGDANGVQFYVSDNGIGMDRETRERATTMFFSSKGTEGTGLGLFVADKVAKQHGGSIAIDSEKNAGATFTIRLPRIQPKLPRSQAPDPQFVSQK